MQARLAKAQVLQGHGYTHVVKEWEELAACLRCKLAPTQTFFKAKLHQNSEADFFTMQNVMAGR